MRVIHDIQYNDLLHCYHLGN